MKGLLRLPQDRRYPSTTKRLGDDTTHVGKVKARLPKRKCGDHNGFEQIDSDVFTAISLLCDSIEVPKDSRCIEAEVQVLRSCRAQDLSQFTVTNYESESATLMATRRFRFAKPGRVVSYQCFFTSTHGSTTPQEMSPSHLSHAPSHLRGIFSFDTSDNLSGHYGDACCASEIGSHRSGILVSLSY
jgi:hypothetical protein